MKKKTCALLLATTMALSTLAPVYGASRNTAESLSGENLFNYNQFLGNEGSQGVYDAKTPRTADELRIKWTKETGSSWSDMPGCPIVVGDYVYSYSSEHLRKLDLLTGKELAKVPVFGTSTGQFFIHLAYGDGKIFVPLDVNNIDKDSPVKKAYFRVFDAETLEQLYITEDVVTGQMQTPVMYHDGYFVTGGYSNISSYACFDTVDEDPSTPNEIKKAKWAVPATSDTGFTWNGACFAGDYVYFSEQTSKRNESSVVRVVNYKTGDVVQEFKLPSKYNSKSTLTYYEKNNRLYVASNNSEGGASIRAYLLNDDGTVNTEDVKEWKSGTSGGGTQSTPVIYNDRLYIGGGGGTMGSGEPFHVVDANTMEEIYKIDALKTKGSAAVSTAYATKENGNQVYIYMVPYNSQGNDSMYIIKDREGQTKPEYETKKVGGNFCSQTVAIAKNGYMVWYNDDKSIYVCGRKDSDEASAYTGEEVKKQIERLDDPAAMGYYNKVEIGRIEARYNGLSDEEKKLVTNFDKLEKIKEVIAMAGNNPIDKINAGIAALPEDIAIENKGDIDRLLAAYKKLTEEEKAQITNYDKLVAASEKVDALIEEAKINEVNEAINNLPEIKDLVSGDKGKVQLALEKYNGLSDENKAKVKDAKKLLDADKRIKEIEKQMADVTKMIKDNLEGKKVGLATVSIIKEIDKAMEGLNDEDIAKISEVEQFLSPAKVDAVNLMIEKVSNTPVNGRNKAYLRNMINDIEALYGGILPADKKYVKDYEKIKSIKEKVDELFGQEGGNTGNTGNTGSATGNQSQTGNGNQVATGTFPKTADTTDMGIWVILLILSSAAVISQKKYKESK